MFAYELEGLKRLNIHPIKWGSSYRVKIRGKTGRMTYISNLSRPSNLKLIAKQYKVSIEDLKKHMSPDYKADPKYRFYNGKQMESHLYEGIQPTEFYKLENVLTSQKNAFKVNIALGYDLVSLTDDLTQYWHPNISNTSVFNTPIAINSQSDIRKKVISEIRSMELANKLNYPSSGYKLKSITGFRIYIYHRNHALGDSDAIIPKITRENQHVINFPKTNNKCVFHCIAWHLLQDPKKNPRTIQAQVKKAFNRYCSFKGISYSLGLFHFAISAVWHTWFLGLLQRLFGRSLFSDAESPQCGVENERWGVPGRRARKQRRAWRLPPRLSTTTLQHVGPGNPHVCPRSTPRRVGPGGPVAFKISPPRHGGPGKPSSADMILPRRKDKVHLRAPASTTEAPRTARLT